jgi:hypothetical protein
VLRLYSLPSSAVTTLIGIILVAATIRDVSHELFHPEMRGSVSRVVMHAVWRGMRPLARYRRSLLNHAGPAMLMTVVAVWSLLVATGWALVYWPRLNSDFSMNASIAQPAAYGFATALYLSLAVLSSMGASDLVPTSPAMKFAEVLEPFVGLVIITAWITWVLSIYPVIEERRAYAQRVLLLREAEPDADRLVAEAPHEAVAEILRSLTDQLITIFMQLGQARVSYYFQSQQPRLALTDHLPWLLALGRAAERQGQPPLIRHLGTALRLAVESFVADLTATYLNIRDVSVEAGIEALARDHLLPAPPAS